MRNRIDQDCPIPQKAPRNGSVAKKIPKKHGKGKPSTVKMTRILQHLPNNGGRSGSDQSDSAQSDSAQLYCVPKLVTGKLRRGKQMSRLLPTLQNNAGHSGSDQSDSPQSDSAQLSNLAPPPPIMFIATLIAYVNKPQCISCIYSLLETNNTHTIEL